MDEFFYPPPDSQFPDWLKNFVTKVTPHVDTIGITTDEQSKLTTIKDALVFTGERIATYEGARLEFVRTRQFILYGDETNELLQKVVYEEQPAVKTEPAQAPAKCKPFIHNLVLRVRNCPGLNENQKKEMGAMPKPRSESEAQAVVKGSVVNGLPVLECKLYGLNGFEIWRRPTGTPTFAYFDRSASNTYTDDSELPEGLNAVQYDYQIRLIDSDNEPATRFSNTVTLTKTA